MALNQTQKRYLEERVNQIVRNKKAELEAKYRSSPLSFAEMYEQIKSGKAKLKSADLLYSRASIDTCFDFVKDKDFEKNLEAKTKAIKELEDISKKLLDEAYLGDIPNLAEALANIEAFTI